MNKEHSKKCCRGGAHAPMRCHCACVCDGYHTFDELYDHRITLFIALCRVLLREAETNHNAGSSNTPHRNGGIWRSKKHSDGTMFDGWFVLGIRTDPSHQITYHLPISRWKETDFAFTLKRAPEWDGHTPDDVLKRLKKV